MPVESTNQPNKGFNFSLLIIVFKYIHKKIPTVLKLVNSNKKRQSITVLPTLPINPISALVATIKSDVETAFFIGICAEKSNVGITKKPPPTPTNPVRIPTKTPLKTMVLTSITFKLLTVISFFCIIEK